MSNATPLRRGRSLLALVAVAATLLVTGTAAAQSAEYYAKINRVRASVDGSVTIWASMLDRLGVAPELRDYERITVSFGGANQFFGEDVQVTTFADAGIATDYVLVLPGYEGFGVANALAAARGAGSFQDTYVDAEAGDTSHILMYGDGVIPLGDTNARDLVEIINDPEQLMRVARPYMLSALDEAIRHFEELPRANRRVVVLVGNGYDVQLAEASMVRLEEGAGSMDMRRARNAVINHHQNILREYIAALEVAGIRVYTLGFNETRADYLEVLEVLARKTGGTHRRVRNIGDLANPSGGAGRGYEHLGSELRSELVIRPAFAVEGGKEYEVSATFRLHDDNRGDIITEFSTPPFYVTIEEEERKLNLIPILIVVGAILIVVFLLLVAAYFMSGKLRAQRAHQNEIKRLKGVVALATLNCPRCYRVMQPDWQQCLFCGSGMPPLAEKPQVMVDAEEAQKKLDELEGRTEPDLGPVAAGTVAGAAAIAAATGKRTCPTCFRVMENGWTSCLFCDAGMPPLPGGPEGAAAAPPPVAVGAGAQQPRYYQAQAPAQPQQAAADPNKGVVLQGVSNCPRCGRPVPPDWQECLYCKAGV